MDTPYVVSPQGLTYKQTNCINAKYPGNVIAPIDASWIGTLQQGYKWNITDRYAADSLIDPIQGTSPQERVGDTIMAHKLFIVGMVRMDAKTDCTNENVTAYSGPFSVRILLVHQKYMQDGPYTQLYALDQYPIATGNGPGFLALRNMETQSADWDILDEVWLEIPGVTPIELTSVVNEEVVETGLLTGVTSTVALLTAGSVTGGPLPVPLATASTIDGTIDTVGTIETTGTNIHTTAVKTWSVPARHQRFELSYLFKQPLRVSYSGASTYLQNHGFNLYAGCYPSPPGGVYMEFVSKGWYTDL